MKEPVLTKVLIANRGEIARRVMRACRALGLQTVAVYSEADRYALHVEEADEAYPIGPPPPLESYLRGDKIIEIALKSGCQAIHPGYGFLSENPDFAQAVEEAGLVFVGPKAEAIRLLGDKLAARRLAQSLGIPTVPGTLEKISDPGEARRVAQQIGYPVLIKAAAGGGGKGMRVVQSAEELPGSLERAMSEAQSAFGDPSVFIEKFVPHAKHIEVQILADDHGNVVHLYERECSVQRRHQKLIEESPAPLLSEAERARLCEAAVQLARAARYRSAGTVEFLYDFDAKRFYFLEVNTRVQVEHPVTEMRTGIDIVQEQLRIAAGEKLSFSQDEIRPRGHAIELRICAEDPWNNFYPSLGQIVELQLPQGEGIRIDHALRRGEQVTPYYDPLIAKLIVWGEDRSCAIARALHALGDLFILGVRTTCGFHYRALQNEVFRSGAYFTDFIERESRRLFEPLKEPEVSALAAAALLREVHEVPSDRQELRFVVTVGERTNEYLLTLGNPLVTVRGMGQEFAARLSGRPGSKLYRFRLGDEELKLALRREGDRWMVLWRGEEIAVKIERAVAKRYRALLRSTAVSREPTVHEIASHMPGLILKVAVTAGQRVEPGETLFVLEAMKMENEIRSPVKGIVEKLCVNAREQVEKGQVLCTIRREP
ncbi:MAG: acetyl-CoA carboxylase biotin carboxylase subunit [Candidatus Bipolaricaulota bacterium]|nr:acetyl-CoA carboxylase biotin carboxylase subunit [Candidatus Bipolaricaulota bacterium]